MKTIKLVLLVEFIALSIVVNAQLPTGDYIISNEGDTIPTKLMVAKKKRVERVRNYQFVTAVKNNKTINYTAEKILGYRKGTSFFRSFRPLSSDSAFFAKEVTTGKVDVYYSILSKGVYYFKKKNEQAFYALEANSKYLIKQVNDPFIRERTNSTYNYNKAVNPTIPVIQSNERAFQEFFIQYLQDNQSVVNKIKHKFYTLNSIESMFKEYNNN